MPVKTKLTLARIALLVSTLTLALLAAEWFYRGYLRGEYRRGIGQWEHELLRPEPGAAFEFSMYPSVERVNRIPTDPDRTWKYTTNEDGFRGEAVSPEKAPGVRRVLFLGDSYTFGWAVDDDDTYAAQFESAVNRRQESLVVESVNLGVPGYNTVMEHALVAEIADKYKPDLVVLSYIMNDAEPQAAAPQNPDLAFRHARSWLLASARELWLRHEPVAEQVRRNRILRPSLAYTAGFSPQSLKWQDSRDALFAIHELCSSLGVPLLVAIIPDVTQFFDDRYCCRIIHEAVAEWSSGRDILVVDLLPEFEGKDHEDYWVEGDGHPNPEAHRMIAEKIAETVLRDSLLSGN